MTEDVVKRAREFIAVVGNCGLEPDRAQRFISSLCDEVEALRKHVADLNHDFEEAIKECNERH